jgi:hypothetical protein
MIKDNLKLRKLLESFNMSNYSSILTFLREFGTFVCPDVKSGEETSYFLRHDVDFSPTNALMMARIESEQGVHAHYYFLTDSSSYNIQTQRFKDIVSEINFLGHCIGLHFERINLDLSEKDDFDTQIERLKKRLGRPIHHFSPHNPGSLASANDLKMSGKYTNAYSLLESQKAGYLSDSNGKWSEMYLEAFMNTYQTKSFQILIHPEWWTYKSLEPLSRIIDVYLNSYLENLNDFAVYHKNSSKFNENEITKFENQVNLISQSISDILE